MDVSIETKGFKPGAKQNKLVYKKLQDLSEFDHELVWAEFRLTFEENFFHLIFA